MQDSLATTDDLIMQTSTYVIKICLGSSQSLLPHSYNINQSSCTSHINVRMCWVRPSSGQLSSGWCTMLSANQDHEQLQLSGIHIAATVSRVPMAASGSPALLQRCHDTTLSPATALLSAVSAARATQSAVCSGRNLGGSALPQCCGGFTHPGPRQRLPFCQSRYILFQNLSGHLASC